MVWGRSFDHVRSIASILSYGYEIRADFLCEEKYCKKMVTVQKTSVLQFASFYRTESDLAALARSRGFHRLLSQREKKTYLDKVQGGTTIADEK